MLLRLLIAMVCISGFALSAQAEDPTLPSNTVQISSPDEKSVESELPVKYWGNCSSLKFHRPSCPFAKSMNARHVVFFHFRHEAIEAGQIPCRYCLPPIVTRVRCVLLPRGKTSVPEGSTTGDPGNRPVRESSSETGATTSGSGFDASPRGDGLTGSPTADGKPTDRTPADQAGRASM